MKTKKIIFKMGKEEVEKQNIQKQSKEYEDYIQKEDAFVKKYLKEHIEEFEELMWERVLCDTKKEISAYEMGFVKGARLMLEILTE